MKILSINGKHKPAPEVRTRYVEKAGKKGVYRHIFRKYSPFGKWVYEGWYMP